MYFYETILLLILSNIFIPVRKNEGNNYNNCYLRIQCNDFYVNSKGGVSILTQVKFLHKSFWIFNFDLKLNWLVCFLHKMGNNGCVGFWNGGLLA